MIPLLARTVSQILCISSSELFTFVSFFVGEFVAFVENLAIVPPT